jgi:hypothetical protein
LSKLIDLEASNVHVRKFLKLFTPIHIFLLSWGLVAFAAIMNASMDTIDHHYKASIFVDMGEYFNLDWTRKCETFIDGKCIEKKWFGFIPIHPMFFDFWHLAKVLMLGALFAAGMFTMRRLKITIRSIIFYLIFGITSWVLVFNLFYDSLLLK